MLTVHLHNARFFAHHGMHAEEALLGNEFEVSLDVSFPEDWSRLHELAGTVNYAELFEMVRQRMGRPTALLEKLAGDIIEEIRTAYPFVKRIKISIFKLQAIIPHLDGKVGVSLEKEFNE